MSFLLWVKKSEVNYIMFGNELQSSGPFMKITWSSGNTTALVKQFVGQESSPEEWMNCRSWRVIHTEVWKEGKMMCWNSFCLRINNSLTLAFLQWFQSVSREVIKITQILFINSSGNRRYCSWNNLELPKRKLELWTDWKQIHF